VAPLVCYNLSRCFSCKNIKAVEIPDQIVVQKVPETSKYENRRFFYLPKIKYQEGNFEGKSQKLSKYA
jgi:hypothetical protein